MSGGAGTLPPFVSGIRWREPMVVDRSLAPRCRWLRYKLSDAHPGTTHSLAVKVYRQSSRMFYILAPLPLNANSTYNSSFEYYFVALPETSKASKIRVMPGANPPYVKAGAHRVVDDRRQSDDQPQHVGVDRLVGVLVAVGLRHEMPVGAGHQHGALAEHEHVHGAGQNSNLPARLGEVVAGDAGGVVGGGGVECAATAASERLVEVVVVVAEGDLDTRDLDPGEPVDVAVRWSDPFGDDAAVVLVDERHLAGVDELGRTDDDAVSHDSLSARWNGDYHWS